MRPFVPMPCNRRATVIYGSWQGIVAGVVASADRVKNYVSRRTHLDNVPSFPF